MFESRVREDSEVFSTSEYRCTRHSQIAEVPYFYKGVSTPYAGYVTQSVSEEGLPDRHALTPLTQGAETNTEKIITHNSNPSLPTLHSTWPTLSLRLRQTVLAMPHLPEAILRCMRSWPRRPQDIPRSRLQRVPRGKHQQGLRGRRNSLTFRRAIGRHPSRGVDKERSGNHPSRCGRKMEEKYLRQVRQLGANHRELG